MNLMKQIFVMLAIVSSVILSCSRNNLPAKLQDNLSNKVILEWNEAAFNAIGGVKNQHSLLASRINAMVHIAMHDALNAITPTYEQYAYKKQVSEADAITAAASAAYTVLASTCPDKKSMLDSLLAISLAAIPEGPAKSKGITTGI